MVFLKPIERAGQIVWEESELTLRDALDILQGLKKVGQQRESRRADPDVAHAHVTDVAVEIAAA